MALIYQCDSCRDQYRDEDKLRYVSLVYFTTQHRNEFSSESGGYRVQVCVSCARRIAEAFDAGKEKK